MATNLRQIHGNTSSQNEDISCVFVKYVYVRSLLYILYNTD